MLFQQKAQDWNAEADRYLAQRDELAIALVAAEAASRKMADAADLLWVVLANVSGGDWTQQSQEWQEVAARWRDNYFAALKADALLAAPVASPPEATEQP